MIIRYSIIALTLAFLGASTAGAQACVDESLPDLGSAEVAVRSSALVDLVERSLTDAACKKAAAAILIAMLNDRESDVRVIAAIALVRQGGQAKVDAAVPILAEDLHAGPSGRKQLVRQTLQQADTTEAAAAIREFDEPWWRIWD